VSTTNGKRKYRKFPKPDELRALIKDGLKLEKALPKGDWTAKETGNDTTRWLRMELENEFDFRQGGRSRNGKEKRKLNDICQVTGGLSKSSRAIAEFIEWARNNVYYILTAVKRLQDVTPDENYQIEPSKYKPTAASHRLLGFVDLVGEALEVLGFKPNTLGYHPFDRLIGSDRKEKAEVLRRLADSIDPVNDETRLRKKNWREQVPLNGLPTIKDFHDLLPDTLKTVLDMNTEWDEDDVVAALDLITEKKWNLTSAQVRYLIRMTMASFAAWENFENSSVPGQEYESDAAYEGLSEYDRLSAVLDNRMKRLRAKKEYYGEDARNLSFQIMHDPDWLRETKNTVDEIFDKAMKQAPTGHGLWLEVSAIIACK